MKNLKAYILYVMNFYATIIKFTANARREFRYSADFLLHKLSHPLLLV